jgi:hypothetical protein
VIGTDQLAFKGCLKNTFNSILEDIALFFLTLSQRIFNLFSLGNIDD